MLNPHLFPVALILVELIQQIKAFAAPQKAFCFLLKYHKRWSYTCRMHCVKVLEITSATNSKAHSDNHYINIAHCYVSLCCLVYGSHTQ